MYHPQPRDANWQTKPKLKLTQPYQQITDRLKSKNKFASSGKKTESAKNLNFANPLKGSWVMLRVRLR